ncbi:MAG: class I SAM-dependent methyltransferase [Acidobacteriaceae bacterium]|nr:class I SAM-dependent methyltransferase [Acidobacteriaceae bacterium]
MWRHLWFWAIDRELDGYFDRKFGITSSGHRSLGQLGPDAKDCVYYQPVSYGDFRKFLNSIPIRTDEDVFLDFGCGMGRALCLAATYPFRSVIGVEISPELCASARENVELVKSKLRCQDVRIIRVNARDYKVPTDVSVIYLFHPFTGQTLTDVLQNIADSLREAPREIFLLFYGRAEGVTFQIEASNCGWLDMISKTILPTGRIGLVYRNVRWTGKSKSWNIPSQSTANLNA